MNPIKTIGFIVVTAMLLLLFYKPEIFLQQNAFDTSLSINEKYQEIVSKIKFWKKIEYSAPLFTTSEAVSESKPLYSGFSNINEKDVTYMTSLQNNLENIKSNKIFGFSTYKWPILLVLSISISILLFTFYITLSHERPVFNIVENADLIARIDSLESRLDVHELHLEEEQANVVDNSFDFESKIKEFEGKLLTLEDKFINNNQQDSTRNNKNEITLN